MSQDTTPIPEYEPSTGYLVIAHPTCRVVLCRLEGFTLYWWDSFLKEEKPMTLTELIGEMEKSRKDKAQS